MAEKFLVIDGSSLIHRAFFAMPPLTTVQGVQTGAVYGLCNMLLRLLDEVKPTYMAVAFDKSRKTFRTKLYPDYKGQRKPTDPALSEQFPLSMKVLEAVNIRTLELDDYEADDIIGTYAAHAPEDVEVIVVTGDKDELQLIDDRTKIFYTRKGITDIQIFDAAEFAAQYEGLVPKQIIDLKGLMGDTSDNIPGVRGVGPKTAIKLIKEYGSVEKVLENIENISAKGLRTKLETDKETALLSKELATICTEAPIDLNMELCRLLPVKAEAKDLMRELEFKNVYERFVNILGSEDTAENADCGDFGLFGTCEEMATPVELLSNKTQIDGFFNKLAAVEGVVPFVAESCGQLPKLNFQRAEFFLDGTVYVLDGFAGWQEQFCNWLASDKCKATTNSKEIYKTCLSYECKARGIVEDAALAAYLVDAGRGSYELEALAERYLPKARANASENLAELLEIFDKLLAERQQQALYKELELPLAAVLAKMEFVGITPDMELLDQLNEDISFRIQKLEKQAEEQAGVQTNLNSPKQLGVLLFETLGLPVIKKNKTGYSTDAKVLEELSGKHPIIETILEYRKLTKLKSTYLDGLKPLVNPLTGRIHTHFQQTVAVTGRLSSTDPNLQNIPTRTEEGKQIRRMFKPGKGYDYLMSCDYSQVELRILACVAQDQLLLESFRHGQDVHARTAAEVFAIPIEEMPADVRNKAKAVNFGIVYGISDFGLANQLKVTRAEAKGYIESYLARYTGVKAYMENVVAEAREHGYVATLMGRRRYLPDLTSRNFNLRSFAERTAINTPIQGTAADIMKKAMIDVDKALEASGLKTRVLLQVHDELVLEVPENEMEQAAELVRSTMIGAAKLEIPLLADVKFGKNWAEAK